MTPLGPDRLRVGRTIHQLEEVSHVEQEGGQRQYLVDDVDEAIAFYTTYLDFELITHPGRWRSCAGAPGVTGHEPGDRDPLGRGGRVITTTSPTVSGMAMLLGDQTRRQAGT